MSALQFLPKKKEKRKRNTGFRLAMCVIKSQEELRKKICSKGLPSCYSVMIFRNFTKIKYFIILCIREQNTLFGEQNSDTFCCFW